jgi:replicative DNA helicase
VVVQEYEKAILAAMLKFPDDGRRIPQRVVAELDDDKFEQPAHKLIYRAISGLVQDKRPCDVLSVASALGADLEAAGGQAYLQSLPPFLSVMGTPYAEGFETWIQVVDGAGRMRHLGLVVDKYARIYDDFDRLVSQTSDVDAFMQQFIRTVNEAVSSTRSNYFHISNATTQERTRLEAEQRGFAVDLIPICLPSLTPYYIPRPSTLGIVAGLSSMGKTQFVLQMMLGAAMHMYENNISGCVAINELETVGWRLSRRMACCLTGVDSTLLASGRVVGEQYARYMDMLDYIDQLPIYYDDNPNTTSAQFGWQSIALHIEKGPRVLGIGDYIELFADKASSEELRVANVVRGHRRVCWETGSCEILVSQFNNSVMSTATKIGGIARTRYSGAIGHAADWFVEIYNPPQMTRANIDFAVPDGMSANTAYVLIQKNKDYAIGQQPFEWVPAYTQFKDVTVPVGQVFSMVPSIQKHTDF